MAYERIWIRSLLVPQTIFCGPMIVYFNTKLGLAKAKIKRQTILYAGSQMKQIRTYAPIIDLPAWL
jgi:hypothetical protein